MTVIAITSIDDFANILQENVPVVAHFYAEWSEQCQVMNGVLEEHAQQPHLKNVKFVKLIAEDFPELCEKYNCSAVPLFLFFQGKTLIDRLEGADAPEASVKIKNLVQGVDGIKPHEKAEHPVQPNEISLNDRIKDLIDSHKLMLFMNGSPAKPNCDSSKTIVELLNGLYIEYKCFDVLSDEEIREGLKEYSKWPTYPQLYLYGELIGGADILKKLIRSGEFQDMLSERLRTRLTTLINQAPVMVFMKGDPKDPKCGFSKQLLKILNETKVAYQTFDILKDDDVREGLKTHSNWPTYPQLYVNGHLIGGLDIVKELQESQMLMQTLTPKV